MTARKPPIRTRRGNLVDYLSARCADEMPGRVDGAEVLYEEYGVQLRLTKQGEYLLNVLCGRVGQFGVEMALSADEIARFQEADGDTFIHELGARIHDNPGAFTERIVRRG